MPYNPETEQFFQAPATIVDSTPDGDTVQEGFDDRLTPAMSGVYTDLNLLKENGMIGVGIPATTTSRGIGRVATLADMEPGAVVENGPAFLDVEGGVIATTPTAHAVPQADADGTLNNWFGGVYDYIVHPSMTGSATLNGTTNNTVQLTGIVTTLGLEVGDVIRIQYSGYNKLHTVESITNNNLISVNYEHAGNRGNGSLKLANTTASVTITRIAKWYNAPMGLGQAWVDVNSLRAGATTYTGPKNRTILVSVPLGVGPDDTASIIVNEVAVTSIRVNKDSIYAKVPTEVPSEGSYRRSMTEDYSPEVGAWVEMR